MSFKVKVTPAFERELKRIFKKQKGIKADVAKLISNLENNPKIGVDLGQGFYKIRLSISGSNKGKSGGARVITFVVFVSEIVYLSAIYLKNETESVDIGIIINQLKDDGLL